MPIVVGVDGGGTKTTAVVIDGDVNVLATATGGPSNNRSVSTEEAGANITKTVMQALTAAGTSSREIDCLCMCLSGFDTELDLPVPELAITQLQFEGVIVLENDVIGAWAGATEARPGVVVIAGTGSTALGMNERGEFWRTDGWDYILGDGGGAYAIGLQGLRLAMKMIDARVQPSQLLRKLYSTYGAHDGEAMRRLVDSSVFGKLEIADFARHVAEAAAEGDPSAQAILTQAGVELGENVAAIVKRLDMANAEFTVCPVGSVFLSVPWVTAPFEDAVRVAAPRATVTQPLHEPEVGAAILGLQRLRSGDYGSWTLRRGQRAIPRSIDVGEWEQSERLHAPKAIVEDPTPESTESIDVRTRPNRSRWFKRE